LNRADLDGRTNAAKVFDRIASSIASDLGGETALSTIQRYLIEAYAGAAVTMCDLNARRAMGEDIDIGKLSQAVSAMVRVASRLGIERQSREVVMSPLDYAASFERESAP
jgi:hypothetical protein